MQKPQVQWAYGVTTVPSRYITTLASTLSSLQEAGFAKPRLFVDGTEPVPPYLISQGKVGQVTYRDNIKTAGNWILAAWELYLRQPDADRYAIFQDDFVTYRNLRAYLDSYPYPAKGYLNLYTFPENEKLANGRRGFYRSNQLGRGAVGLVFSREAMITLLGSNHLAIKPQHPKRPTSAIDGAVSEAMKKAGWSEYVHSPSLVQHTGIVSSMNNKKHPLSNSFLGREFDAMGLLVDRTQDTVEVPQANRTSQAKVPAVPLQSVPVPQVREAEVARPEILIVSPPTEFAYRVAETIGAERWITVGDNPTLKGVNVYRTAGGSTGLRKILSSGVHTVVFIDAPFFPSLLPTCAKLGLRVVGCLSKDSYLSPAASQWSGAVSAVVCPGPTTYAAATAANLPAVQHAWPTATGLRPALRGAVMGQLPFTQNA